MRRSIRVYGSRGIGFACLSLIVAAGVTLPAQQQIVPGTNVNMVSGTKFPDGDPYLQRQNEPSSAVSTRNPLHILGSANDYRTVDIPHPLDTLRTHLNNADAWLGLFKSLDGGQNWTSTLLPGYPQDPTRAAPLWGYDAATDPVIRAGTDGMFYFAGLAFNRGDNAPSAIFVSRFMDMNNLEAGDPIVHLGTGIVDSDTGARFLDKTALATDIPRTAATCTFNVPLGDAANTVVPQTIPAGNVYVAYSAFTGQGDDEQSVIMFTRSTDCGTTWSAPKALSTGSRLVQNAQIAVDPATGYVYVSWRRFHYLSQDDAVMVVRSTNAGTTFGKPVRVAGVQPFDQPTRDTSFRSNGFQTMTVDGTGRAYLAWTERGHATLRPSTTDGDARIVISTSTNGSTWTVPRVIAPDGLGHQLMPALTFHAGRLRLLYYDLREDVSQVFAPFVDEFNILQANSTVRHTMDVFVAQANPGVAPVFTTARLSDYAFGFTPDSDAPVRLQFNPPNLPLFKQGTAPFMGDYIDLAPAPAFVQNANGTWSHNIAPSTSATSHAFWTDNRDVRPPRDGDWTKYAPPRSAEVGTQSRFDPSVTVPACTADHDGMRNQNIYTARVTEGLFVSAPGNNKPLGDIQRAFVVVAENATGTIRSFRLTIDNQPIGGEASFLQFSPLPSLDVTVPPFSSVARTVFASSTDERARITVSIAEITTPGGTVVAGGLAGAVILNPDPNPQAPRLQNPRLQNPRLQNPLITAAEAYNAGITNAVFAVPRLQNPRLQNPSIENPRLQNDSLGNPRLQNDAVANPDVVSVGTTSADIENPRLQNPRLQNPRLQNQALDDAKFIDTSWAITNDGNTTAAYTINLVLNEAIPAGFASQLLIHKTTTTPASIDCNLAEQIHTVLIANIPDPEFVPFADIENPRLQNPRLQNPTIALAPGESATVTLRIVDPDRFDDVTYDASGAVTPAAVAQSVNTEDVAAGITTPTVAVPMTITTTALPSAAPGAPYTRSLQTLASTGALTCSLVDGALPPGVGLSSDGTISGTPTTPGNYRFTVRCVDANGNVDDQPLFIQIEPQVPAGFDAAWNGGDTDWSNPDNWSPRGVPQATDRVYIPAAISVVATLTRNVTVRDLVVEPGARVDTNGFTLTVTHNADAGRTIVGSGTTILTGDGGVATGVFSNLEIRGRVTLNGPVTATGRLTLAAGARLNLNGQSLIVGGQLASNVTTGALPVISGPASSFIVAGVLVNGLVLENAPLTIDGTSGTAALSQFDNVRFGAFAAEAVQLTINHPGLTTHFAMAGASFTTTPTTGQLLQANDTSDGANTLIIDVVRAVPADGTAATGTSGGALVNWISDPGDANLAVTQSVSPIPAVAGTPLTYVITVTNGGPAAATGVTLNPGVPAGATGVTSLTTQGTCTAGAGGLACSLGTLAAGAQAVVTVSFVPPGVGTLVTTATVSGAGLDVSQANNSHTIAATVVAAGAGINLTLAKTGSAASVAVGAPFGYELTVTNAGLTTATGVTAIDPIPAGLTISSATASQGACSIAAGQVVCSLGTLGAGQTVTIVLSASAMTAGLVTNAASVTSDGLELTPADNYAVVQTMVVTSVGCSVPAFTGPESYQGSPGPTAVVKLVDMDHDGDLDVVATHETQGGGVDVFLNDGAGHFAAPRFTSTVTGPWVHVVADFNGDTHPDVISSSDGTNGNPPTLRLLTNDGTGALTLVPTFSVPFGGWLQTVDIDRDGDEDVVFVTPQDNVALLRNDGAAGLAAPVTILSGGGGFFGLGDYNGDNRTDVIVPLGAGGYGVALADTAGGFLPPVVHAVPGGVNFGSTADLNGDGHLDLLLIAGDQEEPSGHTSVVLGDGGGGFSAPVDVAVGSFIYFPTLADVNGDGKIDLAAINGLNGIEVRLGDGAGGFSSPVQFANANGYGPAVGDVNGDGQPDLVSPDRSGQINVFLNNCGAPAASLGVTVTDSADPVNEGDEVTYTVTLTNHAGTEAIGVRLRSVLGSLTDDNQIEPNVTVVSTTSSAGGTLTAANGIFTWTLATVAANSTATFQFRFRTLGGGPLIFVTGATSDGAETDPFDNTAAETTAVNSAGRTLTVTNTNDSGPGSLRQALTESNGDRDDVDRIAFDIGAGGAQTITVLTPLPEVTAPAFIDGTTQPGFSGTPIIELNGNGLAANGLSISSGSTTVRGLVINRFGQNGIAIFDGGGNVIEGNYIGVDVTGAAARPNAQQGVMVLSPNNRVGGPTAAARNIISGNTNNGIGIFGATATGNIVQGNYVGTNASGAAAVPNLGFEGISIVDAPGNSILGNVVSGNASHGIQVFGAASVGNILQGNLIGTDPTGTSRIANAFVGVQVWSARDTIIGGPGAARNIISGNSTGIELRTGAGGTRVENNYIGVNAAGTAAIANAVGISINDAANGNTVGGTTAGAGNVISGNTNSGVSVTNNAQFNLIQGNRIGTNANGIGAVPNGTGVSVAAPNTTVGGTNPLARNVLSGNTGYGVSLTSSSQASVVQGNYIGTNIAGTAAVPNGLSGVNVSAFQVTIGGTAAGAGNVISGNLQNGIRVSLTAQVQVQGNFIGTVATGTAALANGSDGVSIISADDNTIGGTAAGAGNVISGNVGNGISISSAALDNIIQGNLIGTNATGTAAVGNQRGILNFGANTIIGGTTAAARNVISGNATVGVGLGQPSSLNGGADRTSVQGNFIGTDIGGTGAIPNLSDGVSLSTAWITIGGTLAGAGNSIRNNGGAGVAVNGSTAWNNRIQGNSISGNGGLGIDLNANGVTANDAGDGDEGPNHLQNFPVLTAASGGGATITVQGTLDSTPDTTFTVELFGAADDSSGFGEGAQLLGRMSVVTNAAGTATFTTEVPSGGVTSLTATATDPAGNTSEFSAVRAVALGPQTFVVSNTNDSGAGSLRQAIMSANASAGTLDTIAFNIPGAGPHTIALLSALPPIADRAIIDGTTQPGFAGTPIVELNGAGTIGNGLQIDAGPTTIQGLVINRFPGSGILINSGAGNILRGNYIGLDVTGTSDLGNGLHGVDVRSAQNVIGGTTATARNVISGNDSNGIFISGSGATSNVVQGNYIGTNAAGTAPVGNTFEGITVFTSGNSIGGTTPGAGNVLAGNRFGLWINSGANNLIQGNFVGTNAASATGLGNVSIGVLANGPDNIVGGTVPGAANVIVANGGEGLRIAGPGSTGNLVLANYIGTDAAGVAGLGNAGPGVSIFNGAANNIIGDGSPNTISGNAGAGISVTGTATGNVFRSNTIQSNQGLGIDLGGDGPTANDTNDVDTGANGLQNFPVLSNAALTATQLSFDVTLNSVAGRPHTLEFYRNASCDASGFGEGQTLLAVSTFGPVVQVLNYSVTVPASQVAAGDFITATATSSDGTSEFSGCLQVPAIAGQIGLALVDATVVGVGRQAVLEITLPTPAAAGGVTVTVASGSTGLLTVASPGTVAFAAGSTVGQIALTGVQAGTTNVTATASGYADGTLNVLVTENLISTPASMTVPFGQSRDLPVNIGPSPAPPGGLVLDVVSSDPANVEVLTPVITVPEGAFSANASLSGNRIGGANVTVSNAAFSPSTTNVASTAELNIIQAAVSFNNGLPPPAQTIRLESGGTPIAAQPALTVQLATSDATCVAALSPVSIAAGLVSTTFTPAYGGTAALPCTATVTASSGNVLSDAVSITVNPVAAIFPPGPTVVGGGLIVFTAASLGSVQHGGVNVTVTSTDPAHVRVSRDAESAGGTSVIVTVPDGQSFVPYYLQGIENTTGAASITITANGFTSAAHDAEVVAPGLEIYGLDPTTSLLSFDDTDVYVQVGIPSADGQVLTQVQNVRPGPPLIVTLTNSDDAVGRLRSDEPAATGQIVTKPIQPGFYYTQSVAPGTSWGLGFEALTNGTTSVTVSGPGNVRTMSATGVREVQVVGGSIAPPGTVTVGSGLMTFASATLSASGHGGIDVTVTSDDPGRVLVSADTTTVGQSSITIPVPNGQTSVPYYVHAPQNATGSATVTISTGESQFGTTSHSVDVVAAGVEIYGLDSAMSPLSGEDSDWYAQVGIPNADGSSLSQVQVVRTGFPLVLTFTNSESTVGRLRSDQPAATGQSVSKPIQPGFYFTLPEGTGTSWGLAFEPLANGTTTVAVSGSANVRTMSATGVRQVTVANASIAPPGAVTVGSRLMTFTAAQLSAANHGGVEVTVTSSDPAILRLSADGLTEGAASVTIPVPDGQTFLPYYVLGVANAAGTTTVTISAPGFGEASHQVTVVPAGIEILGLDPEMSNLSGDDSDWYVQVGIPSTDGSFLTQVQLVQPGPPLVVTLSNSQATVGRLHSDEPPATGQSVTKPIQPGTYFTIASQPGSFFGLRFEPLSNGTTTVTATGPAGVQTMTASGIRTVNISSPRIIVAAAETVGAGLQTPVFASLNATQHGGVNVTITSSAPDIVRVSPDSTTTGEASFSLPVADGSTSVPFFVQGMENVTGTAVVTLSAPGFETATIAVTVVQSAIEIQGLPTIISAGADEQVNWYVLTGIPIGQGSGLAAAQALRAGAPAFVVTLSASNELARLHSDEPFAVGQTVTKPILPGNYYTQSAAPGTTFGLGFKPLAAGTVVVSVTGPPGVIVTDGGSRTVMITP